MPAVDPLARAQALVTRTLTVEPAPRVIEAGCGARAHLAYPAGARVVGIDILRSQLLRNGEACRLAQGDVTALPVASASADLVVCWDVLEHLPAPERAIAEMARVLRPGGLAVVALPNILSLKGLVTRFTPWWFHVWVYRRVLGDRSVGTDGSDQFPTALRWVLRPSGLRHLATTHGLSVEALHLYEGPVPQHLRRRHRAADVALSIAGAVTRTLSAGHYDTTLSDMIVVLSRPAAGRA
ncbi:putative S-adenosylmethionine-dependent methyltransferase [Luteitalea pratensis]|uniref:Putative S-adenosylmethionine-dependent methyltransferase n=1 Tax=Luteitalea pratensis TaxID=1855912 RepID=A0A143PSQ6_LUTPR|nr:class I SAM-dependent methyltransferase [Luteitalea pratensis]AMY11767.1 putative S-adenosylmethionine-dependent methyltransferase [Luteitalea pratensis]